MWTVGLTEEIKLRFKIPPAQCGLGLHGGAEMAHVPQTDQYGPGSCPEPVVIRRSSLLLVPRNFSIVMTDLFLYSVN